MPCGDGLEEEEEVVDGSSPGPASLSSEGLKAVGSLHFHTCLINYFYQGFWAGGGAVPQVNLLLCHWLNHTDIRSLNSYLLGGESWSTAPTASLAHRAVWLADLSCAMGVSALVMCLELEETPCLGIPGQKVLLLPQRNSEDTGF